ncbi:MAG: alpha/beta hydrolase [Microthrixaceae bacterium]
MRKPLARQRARAASTPVPATTSRTRTTRLLAVLLALAALTTGCSSDGESGGKPSFGSGFGITDGSTDTASSGSYEIPSPDWIDCAEVPGGQCATLQVPLDWDSPGGDMITLALGRIKATGERHGSVVINPGGPGASGLGLLRSNPLSSTLTEHFDTVSWDPRGVGHSTAVKCGQAVPAMLGLDPDPDSPAEQQALDAAAKKVSEQCASSDSELLAHVSTAEVARDLEAIRVAIGDEPLNYVGFSYGTHIGQIYAELHPKEIRTMVLDGVVDPSEGFSEFLSGQTRAFDASFDRNVRACSEAGIKRCGVKDLGKAYDEVRSQVEQEPLGSGSTRVGPAELGTAAVMSAYWADGWVRLGPALAKALDGRPAELRRLADTYTDLAGYSAYAAVVCTDSPPPSGQVAYRKFSDELRRVSPRLGGVIANEMLPCATWPVKAEKDAKAITAEGAPPILVVGNTGDPATPYSNAVDVSQTLASGVLITADIGGHTAYASDACVTKVVDDYIVELVVPTSDPHCP